LYFSDVWAEAIALEINSLIKLDCFEFKSPNFKPGSDYQYAPLRCVFDVKQDLQRKCRQVAGGHVVKTDQATHASTVMATSVRLLHLLAHANALDILCGDVSNAFVNAYTKELTYCRARPEFGDKEGCIIIAIIIIKKASYGLKSSAERWWAHFADSLRALGFKSTRFDCDVWIKDMGVTYAYVCTHVDDFKIVAKDPMSIMSKLQENYLIKDVHPPKYYLGNDYVKHEDGTTSIGSTTYVKEVLRRRVPALGGPLQYGAVTKTDDRRTVHLKRTHFR
jgi:hypothetical protein